MKHPVSALALMTACFFATSAYAQIGGPDQTRFEDMAQAEAHKGDFAEALRYQQLAVSNIDRVAPKKHVYRSWVRYKLGMLMVMMRDCEAALPVFRESASLVDDSAPANPDPYWKNNIIWASAGMAEALICLKRPDDAATELEAIEQRFGEAPYADCAKATVKISATLANRELGRIERARSELAQARAFLAKCDDPDLRAADTSIADRLASKLPQP